MTTTNAMAALSKLGFAGQDVYFAELIPAAEMAWADGEVQPNERAMLEAYCFELTQHLNQQAKARVFSPKRALALLKKLLAQRLSAAERSSALHALRELWGAHARKRMMAWAQAVAAVSGRPVWDTRELFWLHSLELDLEAA